MADQAKIHSLYRYPVKGLSPQALPHAMLRVGQTIAADRLYAIENGPTGFDPDNPVYLPKQRFLMLMRNERLAALRTEYDEATHTLTIGHEGSVAARGDLRTAEGRAAVEAFFASYCRDELRGPPVVLRGKDHSFSDVARKVVSIINLASVAALDTVIGQPVDPLRFRANVYVKGWPAWHEFDLLDREIGLGTARVRIVKRITRCAATDVDPQTGIRDLTVPQTLMQTFNHMDCGVYAEVIGAGNVAVGDLVDET